jgi:hypothetical protein
MGVIRVLGWCRCFEYRGFKKRFIQPPKKYSHLEKARRQNIISIIIILISSIYLSYQGGGHYRGIYDTGFKRGFYGI